MTDIKENLKRYRLPLRRDHLKQARDFAAPAMRYAPRNPLWFIGAAVLGFAGFMAWKNRERIATATGPLIEDAKVKGRALMNEAATRSQALLDEAKAKTQSISETVSEKVASVRRGAADQEPTTDIH